ncbi:DUF58 domain-containing protein [Chloroflexota bacterium]
MPLMVYLIVGFIQAPGDLTLIANRILDKSGVIAHDEVETRVVIKNQGNALLNLYLNDPLFPSMTIVGGQPHKRLFLSAGDSTELIYKFTAARGIYSWKSMHACASDPLGLFELKSEIPAPGELLVRPAPMKTRPVSLKPRHTLHAPGPIPARLAGSGIDFWGIREYRPGDSLRQLNWRLKARHPRKLFTNEYEREEITDFGLILDSRKLTNADSMEEALFEYSVSAAASLSESFLKNGNRVSLLVYGKPINTVFPGYGKKHLNILLRNLAHARQGEYIPFNYLEYFPARLFPTRSVIVIFSTVHSRDVDVYARFRAYDYDVLLISPDPVDYASRILPSAEINTLAYRAARVERIVQLKRLLKLGVKVIDWQVNQPLETIIHKTVNDLIHQKSIPPSPSIGDAAGKEIFWSKS